MRTSEEAHEDCIGSYADNSSTNQLFWFLDNQLELDRLNAHRHENRDMKWFNNLIHAAIALRNTDTSC